MIYIRLSSVIATALLMSVPALAATPVLSGKYEYSQISACASGSDGTAFPPALMTAQTIFNSTAGTLSYSGSIVHFAGPNSYITDPVSGNTTFSNTGTTLTIGSEIYQVTYVAKRGNVTALSGVGISSPQAGETCGDQIHLMKQ